MIGIKIEEKLLCYFMKLLINEFKNNIFSFYLRYYYAILFIIFIFYIKLFVN